MKADKVDERGQSSSKATTALDMFDVKSRVEGGKEVGRLTLQFFLWFVSSIAITIATGIYLWARDKDARCAAPNTNAARIAKDEGAYVEVAKQFTDVLKIFFTVAIVDVVRQFFMIAAVLLKSGALATIYQVLVVNDVLGFGAIFVLHCTRFQLAGRICAGDYQDDPTNYPLLGVYLSDQGNFLKGLVYWVWIGGVLLCTLTACIALCTFKPMLTAVTARLIGAWKRFSLVSRMEQRN